MKAAVAGEDVVIASNGVPMTAAEEERLLLTQDAAMLALAKRSKLPIALLAT